MSLAGQRLATEQATYRQEGPAMDDKSQKVQPQNPISQAKTSVPTYGFYESAQKTEPSRPAFASTDEPLENSSGQKTIVIQAPQTPSAIVFKTKNFWISAGVLMSLLAVAFAWLTITTNRSAGQNNQITQTQDLIAQKLMSTSPGITKIELNRNTTVTGGKSFTATGPVAIQNEADSASAFSIQNAAGSQVMVVDTKNKKIGINTTPSGTAALQVSGNISTDGSIVSTKGGGFSIDGSGLRFGSTLVCTINGCISPLNPTTQKPPTLDLTNVAYLNTTQTFTGAKAFTNTLAVANTNANAFQVQNSGGADTLLTVASSARSASGGNIVKIGNSTGTDGDTTILVLDSASANPTRNLSALNGGLFYNSTTGKIEIIENGVVKTVCNTTDLSCGGNATTLQQAYNYSVGSPQITLDSSPGVGGLVIADNASPLGTSLFTVQNNSGASKYLDVSATGVAVGKAGASYPLDVVGDVNTSTGLRVNGVLVCNSSGCTSSAGSGDYIQNSIAAQTDANFNIVSAAAGSVGGVIRGASGQTADLLDLQDENGTGVVTVGAAGDALFQPSTNSTTAFQIQNANGTSHLFTADTVNARVAIAQPTAGYTLDVGGDINSTTAIRVGGNIVCGGTGCTAAAGSGSYVQNGTALQTANFAIQSANPASIAALVRGASGQSASLLQLVNGDTGNTVLSVANNGDTLIKNNANSTTAFQVQNAAGGSLINVDSTNNAISLLGNISGQLGQWSTSTNSLPAGRGYAGSITANGYVYVLGGGDAGGSATSTVYYAKLNADGSVGAWTTSTNALPTNLSGAGVVTANGYVYVIGGCTVSDHCISAQASTVYYAKLNADGSVGTWTTSTNALPQAISEPASIVANGYVYTVGGRNSSIAQATVYYAKLNADGSTGAWVASTNVLPAARVDPTSVVSNGYIYTIAGDSAVVGSSPTNTVYYAKLNADGSTGAWVTSANPLPSARSLATSVVSNGYVYELNGFTNTVYYAKLNADGSTGAWATNSTLLPQNESATFSTTANGYIYVIGGWTGSVQSSVYYASTSRIQIGANLDLVGLQGGTLSDPGSQSFGSIGGSLTAGNGNFVGALQVQGQGSFAQGLSANGDLTVGGSALFQNSADSTTAFQVQNASGNNMLSIDTTGNGNITIGNATNPSTITFVGGNTASRPASPTKGTLYYDTSTNNLVQYNGSKWQAPSKSNTFIVAASNSTQAEKDAADYVATGADDQNTINTALSALPSGGGSVYLMEGTYTISGSINVPDNSTLSGAGAPTIITIPNSFNADINMIYNSDTSSGTNITISNLLIDGNKANQAQGTMIGVYFNKVGSGSGSGARAGGRIINTFIKNLYGSSGCGIELASSSNNVINSNIISSVSGTGIYIYSGSNNTISGNMVQGSGQEGVYLYLSNNNTLAANTAQGSSLEGIYLNSSAGNTVTGNTSQGNYNGVRVAGSSASNNTISGNSIQASSNYGINISASSNTFSSNKIYDSSGMTANNGIYIWAGVNKNSIIGNDITDFSCTSTCYAINIASGSNNYISSNHFVGDGTNAASITDATGGNTYSNQPLTENGDADFRNATNSTTAFQVQNANSRSLLTVDTQNGVVQVGNTTDGSNISFAATGNVNATIRKNMIVTGAVNAHDAVILDTSNPGQVTQSNTPCCTSYTVFGVATTTNATTAAQDIVTSGIYQINLSTSSAVVAVGDDLLSAGSADPGKVIDGAVCDSTYKMVGRALESKAAGVGGLVWAAISPSVGNLGKGSGPSACPALQIPTMQQTYNMSTGGSTPEIKLNSLAGALDIQDADSTINGSLFTVHASNSLGIGTNLFDVQSTGGISLNSLNASSGNAANVLTVVGGAGASKATAGNGSNISLTAGNGGSGSTTNGNGGNITLSAGSAGAGAGSAGTAGSVIVKNASNSSGAFQVQNSGAVSLLAIDTSGDTITLGDGTLNTFLNLKGNFLAAPTAGNDSASAFQIQNSSGVSLLTADTSGMTITINGALSVTGNLTISGGALVTSSTSMYGTSLPGSPVNGQEYYYEADQTNGVVWHLRYNSTSGYWEFLGGSPLKSYVSTQESTSSSTYTDLTTVGPSFTAPLNGNYSVSGGAFADETNNPSTTWGYDQGYMSVYAGNTPSDSNAGIFYVTTDGTNQGNPSGASITIPTLTYSVSASTPIKLQYHVVAGKGAIDFANRWISVTPVYVY